MDEKRQIIKKVMEKVREIATETGAVGGTQEQANAFIEGLAEALKYTIMEGSKFSGSKNDLWDAIEMLYRSAGCWDDQES